MKLQVKDVIFVDTKNYDKLLFFNKKFYEISEKNT